MIETFIILTIIASLISIYSISPEHQRLRLRFATNKIERIIFVLFFPLISILIIPYAYIESHFETLVWNIFNTDFEVTFLIELLIILLGVFMVSSFSCRLIKSNTKIKNVEVFSDIFFNLLYERKYISAIKLVENTLTFVDKRALKVKYLKKKIEKVRKTPNWTLPLVGELIKGKDPDELEFSLWERFKKRYQLFRSSLIKKKISRKGNIIPIYEKTILDTNFIEQLSSFKPYLGTRLIKTSITDNLKKEFTKLYLFYLIMNSNSILYQEINNNIYLSHSWYRYIISEENVLLRTLFEDISLSSRLSVWFPIARFVENYIEDLSEEQIEYYNSFDSNFSDSCIREIDLDEDILKDPIYIGIRFFEIMVKEAIFQKHNDHMWLPFYDGFIGKMCKVYKTPKNLKEYKEFPNRFSYLIYVIIRNLNDFLLSIDEIDVYKEVDSFDALLKSKCYNIVKATSTTIATSIHIILNASDISPIFEKEQTEIILKTYFKLLAKPSQVTPLPTKSSKVSPIIADMLQRELIVNYMKTDETSEKLYRYIQNLDRAMFTSGEYDTEKREEFLNKLRK